MLVFPFHCVCQVPRYHAHEWVSREGRKVQSTRLQEIVSEEERDEHMHAYALSHAVQNEGEIQRLREMIHNKVILQK